MNYDHPPDHNYSQAGASYRIVPLSMWPFLYRKFDLSILSHILGSENQKTKQDCLG